MSTTDGPISSTNQPSGDPCSTTYSWYLSTAGDTIRIVNKRNIAHSNDTGYPGEFAFGSETILGITTYYLYYCDSTNHWIRCPFLNF